MFFLCVASLLDVVINVPFGFLQPHSGFGFPHRVFCFLLPHFRDVHSLQILTSRFVPFFQFLRMHTPT
jgi:hypothetical protein